MIKYQFNYCPLLLMFCSRQYNNLINKLREWSLRISYKDQKTTYHNLLETHNELMIHERNLQILLKEIYKIVNGVAPPIMNSLFEFWSNKYDIRNFQVLSTDFTRTVNYGIKITYRTSSLWAKLPSEYKLAASLEEFKVKIKKWMWYLSLLIVQKISIKSWVYWLEIWFEKMWICSLLLHFFKKISKMTSPTKKITKQLKMFLDNQKYFM